MIIGGWRGPGWRIIDADPGHARQVRDWIRSAITRHDCPVDPADAALAVSELYANAVMHGPAGGRVLAGYCLWSAGARIVVCDGGGPGTPRVRPGAGLAEGGRGLQVVDSVAARWGSFRLPGPRSCGATSASRCALPPATPGPGCAPSCRAASSPRPPRPRPDDRWRPVRPAAGVRLGRA